ncbi:MAG: RidA family protein [Paracoccaceae bacterium]
MTISRLGKGPRMSQAVICGGIVRLAGQIGSGATVGEQTKDMLASVDRWLAEAGTDKSHLLSATIWLADMDRFDEMNAVWDGWIDPENAPARACVQARLALPHFLVEAMVTAAIPPEETGAKRQVP